MKAKWRLLCGVIAGPLFIITFILIGMLRPHYSALRNSVSALANGRHGWLQVANFEITGLLIMIFAFGIYHYFRQAHEKAGRASLFAIVAVAVIGAGLFKTDMPGVNYPGTFGLQLEHTWHGTLHVLFSVTGFLVLATACFMFAWQFRRWKLTGWASYSVMSGIGILFFLLLSIAAIKNIWGLNAYYGLFERCSIITGLSWQSLFAARLLTLLQLEVDSDAGSGSGRERLKGSATN